MLTATICTDDLTLEQNQIYSQNRLRVEREFMNSMFALSKSSRDFFSSESSKLAKKEERFHEWQSQRISH
jgi:hypothetical protein